MPRPSLLAFLVSSSIALLSPTSQAAKLEFNRDIRPILSDRCFQCHGVDEAQRKGGLRLDEQAAAWGKGKSGELAIVPGKPEASELLKRIELPHADDDVMPPAKLNKPLSASDKALLRQWISEGAEYAGHWAFMQPQRPAVPAKTKAQSNNPIDAFIAQRLEREGLGFSQPASPETLLRRVNLDLVGLPPTQAELDAFLAECRDGRVPDAVLAKTIDRLLRSPHYGERMAMQWLDYARYADSHGFQTDSSRGQWPWRDWVIQAFNSNMPFDQFTVEQLAGDLLPSATLSQRVATGFNRNHRLNGEGGIVAEEWRIENIIDRVETTGLTWLALTLNCCRCHDHKFDPITQKDFYSLFAFFNNVPETGTMAGPGNRSGGNIEPAIEVPSPEQQAKLTELEQAVAQAQAKVTEANKQLPTLVAEWEKNYAKGKTAEPAMWTVFQPTQVSTSSGSKLTRQADDSYLASGPNPPTETYELVAPISARQLSGVLLECLPDASMTNGSLGRAPNGNFVLSALDIVIRDAAGKDKPLTVAKAEATYSQRSYEIEKLGSSSKSKGGIKGWAIDGNTRKDKTDAMFLLAAPADVPAGSHVVLKLRHDSFPNHNIGRFRLSVASLPPKALKLAGGNALAAAEAIMQTPANKRSAKQRADLNTAFRTLVDSPVKRADEALAAAKAARDGLVKGLPSVMVMAELEKPRDAFILTRGEYDKPAGKVTAALPAALPAMPAGQPMNRLGLARWIASADNPLTARVWVNRQWERFFGNGIVKTIENFGMQADYPSHPELLDWLATEFVSKGWDMKAMQKLMLMSQTYRQSSKVSRALIESDPDNRLLARGPRLRLSGELVRDQALAIAGLLVPKVGGPSVRPFMPEGVWDETSKYGDLRGYKADSGEGLYRRTLYTIWKRTAAPPTMLLFDSPTREICTVKRSRTNTPLQALALLNETTYLEAARALAAKMIEQAKTPTERLAWAVRQVTSRAASAEEMSLLSSGLTKRLAFYQSQPDEAAKLLGPAAAKVSNAAELAAYTMTANVLLNLDEVVTRQ